MLTHVRASANVFSPGLLTLGGTLWVIHASILDARPRGCVSSGCDVAGATHRPTEDLLWLFLLSVLALAIGMLRAPISPSRGQRARRVAIGLVVTGAAALTLGLFVNAALPGDSPLWWLHDSDSMGRLLPVLGSVAAGIAALKGQWLGRWHGILLILSALTSTGFNAQTERVLFTVPLGAAWAVVGASCLLSTLPRLRTATGTA